MQTSDLLKKVRKIEIKTRGLTRQVFAGRYHSAFKGRGMTFSEVREYQYGDPIRDIDWNVTARFNHPYVKVFEEERELTVMLIVDLSGSRNFGSNSIMKRDLMTELAAVLSFSAIQNNDKVGVIFFTNKIEKFIPPKKGRTHILRIITELLTFEPEEQGTDINNALEFFTGAIKKRCTAFLISDFIGTGYERSMMIANSKHDLVALRISDPLEDALPNVGLIRMLDAETNQEFWVDTARAKNRELYRQWKEELAKYFSKSVTRSGVDTVDIRTNEDYVIPLMKMFKMRSM
ncbi:MAG TPA: DUF58 domain-containing protein [Salinivirgaceae bacterium]|nr:DUF58 domain-containing protein [Salinivirgaceae bacterium]HQA76403.1 DUF58 domain-containing protein [Salinivirgaceae bacterium]